MITAEHAFDREEHRRAARALAEASNHRAQWRKVGVISIALVFILAATYLIDGSIDVVGTFWPVAVLALVLAIIPLVRFTVAWSRGRDLRHRCLIISDDGLLVHDAVDLLIPWSKISKVVETEEFLLFLIQPGVGHYVPKRSLSEVALQSSREIVRRHVGGRARLLTV
ncbi:MAG TPA: YcxB family protein [Longimicrobiales bacterium]